MCSLLLFLLCLYFVGFSTPLLLPCISSSSPSRLPLLPVAYVPVNVPPPAPTCPPSLIPALTLCCSQRPPVSQAAQGAPLPPPQRLHGLQTQNALPPEPEARGKCVCPASFEHVTTPAPDLLHCMGEVLHTSVTMPTWFSHIAVDLLLVTQCIPCTVCRQCDRDLKIHTLTSQLLPKLTLSHQKTEIV